MLELTVSEVNTYILIEIEYGKRCVQDVLGHRKGIFVAYTGWGGSPGRILGEVLLVLDFFKQLY